MNAARIKADKSGILKMSDSSAFADFFRALPPGALL
jgi:hypothetical protein